MPTPEEAAGREIRRLRISRGWSQDEVAQRMSAYGYEWHQTTVGRIEAAQRPLRLNEAVDLASLYGVPLSALVTALEGVMEFTELEKRMAATMGEVTMLRMELEEVRSRRMRAEAELHETTELEGRVSARVQASMAALAKLAGMRDRASEPPS